MMMKLYFWFFTVMTALMHLNNFVGLYGNNIVPVNQFNLGEVIESVVFLVALVGLYGYVYHKKIFKAIFWKMFFVLFVGLSLIFGIVSMIYFNHLSLAGFSNSITNIVFLLPLMIGLYKYAFVKLVQYEKVMFKNKGGAMIEKY